MSMTAAETALLAQIKAQVESQNAIITALLAQNQSLATMLGGCTSRNTDQGFDLIYLYRRYVEKCGGVLPADFRFPSDASPIIVRGTPATLSPSTMQVAEAAAEIFAAAPDPDAPPVPGPVMNAARAPSQPSPATD